MPAGVKLITVLHCTLVESHAFTAAVLHGRV